MSDIFSILLKAKLDSNARSDLQKELAQLTGLSVNVKINNANISSGNINKAAQQTGQQIGKIISDNVEKVINNVSSPSIGRFFRIDPSTSNQFKAEMEKLVREWTNAKGKLTDIKIDTRTFYDPQSDTNITRLHQAVVTYKNELDEVIKKTIAWRQIGTTTNAKGEEEVLRGFVEVAGQYSKSMDTANIRTDIFIEKQHQAVAAAKNSLATIESKLNDKNAAKSLANTDFNTNGLTQQINQVKSAINTLENSSRDTFTQAKIDVDSEITSLNNLITALKNAKYAATSLRTKDISTIKIDEGNNLDAFIQKMEQSGHYTNELKVKVTNLKQQLSGVFNTDTLTTYLNELSKLQSEFKKIDATAKSTQKATILRSNINTEKQSLKNYTNKLKNAGVLNGEIKQKIQSMFKALSKVDSSDGLNIWKAELKGVKAEADAALKSVTQLSSAKLNSIRTQLNTGKYQTDMDIITTKYKQLGLTQDQINAKTKKLFEAFSNLNANDPADTLTANWRNFDTELQKVKNDLKKMQSDNRDVDPLRNLKLSNQMQSWLQINSRAAKTFGKEIEDLRLKLQGADKVTFNNIRSQFETLKTQARETGKLGKSFTDSLSSAASKLSPFISTTRVVMATVNEMKEMYRSVVALDTALVDLKKTSTMTSNELKEFYYTSNDTAKQMGVTTEQIINQASAWSRLGYSSAEAATQMAKYSSMFATISPGMSLDSATNGLVSVMKAFKIGSDDVNEVVDGIMSKINIIGNTRALDNNDIITFLTRSSSAMAEANNTLEETIALGTAMTEITRNAANAGQVLKTTSMRIRSYDEETESYSEELENISGTIADLTKTAATPGGISLFTDETKQTYKSTYQLLEEISAIYDDLSDKNQAQLLEALAGKRNGQAIAAIISNFDAARTSMESMANSAGNAESEMSIAMDSIAFKSNALKQTAVGIGQNLFEREDIKTVIDFLTKSAEVLDVVTDKLGLFKTVALGTGITAFVKNLDHQKVLKIA